MFNKKNQELYVKNVTFSADNEESIMARMTLYITPITKELAEEIHAEIATTLFNRNGKPRPEASTVGFTVEPAACSMEYLLHKEMKSGRGLIPFVEFDGLRAMKLFADKPDFTLAFNATFECNDKETAWAFINRLRKPILATFREAQIRMFQKDLPACAAEVLAAPGSKDTKTCGQSPKYKVKGKEEYYCVDHPKAAGADIELETLAKEDTIKYAKQHADKAFEEETGGKKRRGRPAGSKNKEK